MTTFNGITNIGSGTVTIGTVATGDGVTMHVVNGVVGPEPEPEPEAEPEADDPWAAEYDVEPEAGL